MRSVVLDTETTGMPVTDGHRIIEIGCVELEGRRLTGRHFHVYLQPDREVDEGAIAVHGITNEYLKDKPRFREVANDFFEFIRGAQLIIHNAAFDIGFINNEFALLGQQDRSDVTEYLLGAGYPADGPRAPSGPAQQPRCVVQALRRGQLRPRPARRVARRRDPRRRLPGDDRRPDQPVAGRQRRGKATAAAGRWSARSVGSIRRGSPPRCCAPTPKSWLRMRRGWR